MELLTNLLGVSVIWGAAVTTPGPNFFITVQTAIASSFRSAMVVVLGISTGTVIWAMSGFLGTRFLLKDAPWIFLVLKILGGGYLVYLGMQHILHGSKKDHKTGSSSAEPVTSGRYFLSGLLTNLSNPKSAAFVTTMFAATIPVDTSYAIGFASVALMSLISICWYSLVAFTFSLQRFRDLYSRVRPAFERLAGAVFIGFGIHLLTSQQ